MSSALAGPFAATSSGFAGVSDGLTDLRDGRMDWRYSSATAGNLVQTAALRGRHTTLALGFAGSAADALAAAPASPWAFGTDDPSGPYHLVWSRDGTPVWGGLQLDEVALPIVLAYQLGRADTWPRVRRAADFLAGYPGAPFTPQERGPASSPAHPPSPRRRWPGRTRSTCGWPATWRKAGSPSSPPRSPTATSAALPDEPTRYVGR